MKKHDIKRLSRLAAILTHLQTKRVLTATELAEKYSVSVRTIYRDIRALEQAGVPIFTEEGKGYSLMEEYRLPPLAFTESEALALVTAEQLVLANQDASFEREFREAISKIKAVLRHAIKDKAAFLQERMLVRKSRDQELSSRYLSVLQLALANARLVKIDYADETNRLSSRIIEPFGLYSDGKKWILFAYCRLRKGFRAFRLDRIQSLHVLNETFEPQSQSLQEFFEKHYATPDI